MIQTIQTLIQICLFRARPQDLPASPQNLMIAVVTTLILSITRISHVTDTINPVIVSLVQIALLGLGLKVLLILFSKRERWLQAATGLFGCSAILLLVAVPFLIITESSDFGVVNLVLVVANVWYFAIIVYILRETLEVRLFLAFLITFAMEMLSAIILLRVFSGQIL